MRFTTFGGGADSASTPAAERVDFTRIMLWTAVKLLALLIVIVAAVHTTDVGVVAPVDGPAPMQTPEQHPFPGR